MGLFDFFKRSNTEDSEIKKEEPAVKTAAPEVKTAETEVKASDSEDTDSVVKDDDALHESGKQDAEGKKESAHEPVSESIPNAQPASQKLTPEQMAERKAKQEELSRKRDSDGMVLSYLIQRHHEIKTTDSFKSALESLQNCWLWVPMRMQMSPKDAQAMQEARQAGKQYAPKDPVRLVPAMIRTKDGQWIYSSFTNKDEIPKEMTKQFMWVQIPSGKCAQTVAASPDISALIINPNSKSLLLKKELLQKLVKPVNAPGQQAAPDLASEPDMSGYTS